MIVRNGKITLFSLQRPLWLRVQIHTPIDVISSKNWHLLHRFHSTSKSLLNQPNFHLRWDPSCKDYLPSDQSDRGLSKIENSSILPPNHHNYNIVNDTPMISEDGEDFDEFPKSKAYSVRKTRSLPIDQLYANLNRNHFVGSSEESMKHFMAALRASDIDRALFHFEIMVEYGDITDDPEALENCLILLISKSLALSQISSDVRVQSSRNKSSSTSSRSFLHVVSDLLTLFVKKTKGKRENIGPPYRAMSYVFHKSCKLSDFQERTNTILKLEYLWIHQFKFDINPIFENIDILTESDIQIIRLVSNHNCILKHFIFLDLTGYYYYYYFLIMQ